VRNLFFPLILLTPLIVQGAEWIELNDGTKVEGKIISAGSETVTIEVQTSPTIREEKSFPRAEVAKVQRASQDDVAFEEVTAIAVPATADNPIVYDAPLEKVRSFMKSYGYSKHMSEARKLAASFEAERGRVAAGEVKVDGQWISGAAAGPDKNELGGRIQLSKMKFASDPALVLMAFDVLEKNHATSSSYPEAVKLARESIGKLRTDLLRARTNLERRTREQEQGLQLASADRRLQMERGIAEEKAAVQAQIDRAKQSGAKWFPLLPEANVLAEMSKLADSEDTRLAKVDVDNMSAAIASAAEAKKQIESGRFAEAKTSLETASRLWPQYVLLASLNESLKKAENEATEKSKEETKPATP
jgi:hypothetical protein